jgi:PilZ domain
VVASGSSSDQNKSTLPLARTISRDIPSVSKGRHRISFCGLQIKMSERNERPIVSSASSSEASPKNDARNRRAGTRYAFTASADVFEPRSNLKVTGRCSDVSSGGCYVDTPSPLNVGARVKIRIAHEHREFEAVGVVVYAHVRMGMGLSFTEVKPEHQAALQAWIGQLSGEPVSEDVAIVPEATGIPAAERPPEMPARAADANVRLVVYKVIKLMVRSEMITENESTELLRLLLR